jgi:ATP-dependent DNA helicase PIF1
MSKRLQFPIIHAFCITINKSQGQTFSEAGVFLSQLMFTHGQLYIDLSRNHSQNNMKVYEGESINKVNLSIASTQPF